MVNQHKFKIAKCLAQHALHRRQQKRRHPMKDDHDGNCGHVFRSLRLRATVATVALQLSDSGLALLQRDAPVADFPAHLLMFLRRK